MDDDTFRNLLASLNRNAFEQFFVNTLSNDKVNSIKQLNEFEGGVYCNELLDSYGGSIHNLYVFHFPPLEIFSKPISANTFSPSFYSKLKSLRNIYEGKTGYWGMVHPMLVEDNKLKNIFFVSNLSGHNRDTYYKELLPKYFDSLNEIDFNPTGVGIGNVDSLIDLNRSKAEEEFIEFIRKHKDGISISINKDCVEVSDFYSEKFLCTGVTRESRLPCEPVILKSEKSSILIEFERLIEGDAKEKDIEEFLRTNYRLVFGSKYDQIETQLWLKFPDLDIRGKDRKLDIFLRNSVSSDWELFELKRNSKLTRTYRDIPVFIAGISHAKQQIKNYARILSQDSVKRRFANEGIEYFEPSLHLVVGRRPQIPHEEWRWLVSSNEQDAIKLITFDDILAEMKIRLNNRI